MFLKLISIYVLPTYGIHMYCTIHELYLRMQLVLASSCRLPSPGGGSDMNNASHFPPSFNFYFTA